MGGLFQRINFFKGLFMKAEDWQKEQQYHKEKHRYHNKYLHRPGVVFDCLGGLEVTVSDKGTHFVIAPGYAIDGEGRDLYLPEQKEIEIPALLSFEPPTTVYITIAFAEEKEDLRKNNANPSYEGYALIVEDTVIDIGTDEPDNDEKIELARVTLSKKPKFIRDAKEPENPGKNELDLTHKPHAGARTATIQKDLGLLNFADKIIDNSVQVRTGTKKLDDTNFLIEKLPAGEPAPMYLVSAHSLDGARIHWWIGSAVNDNVTDYSLHIKNESPRITTVQCRVFRIRV